MIALPRNSKLERARAESLWPTEGILWPRTLVLDRISAHTSARTMHSFGRLRADTGSVVCRGITSVRPVRLAVVGRRPGGRQIQVASPEGGVPSAGPGRIEVLSASGEKVGNGEWGYSSIGWMGDGTMLITSMARGGVQGGRGGGWEEEEEFPVDAAWVVLIDFAGNDGTLDGSWGKGRDWGFKSGGFPAGGGGQGDGEEGGGGRRRVIWRGEGGKRVRVEGGKCTFQPGPSFVRVYGGGEGGGKVAYSSISRVVADESGGQGAILIAEKGYEWPKGIKWVQPTTFCVLSMSKDQLQMQVDASPHQIASSAFGGAITVTDLHGNAATYSYETAASYGQGQTILTAPVSYAFPTGAAYVSFAPHRARGDAEDGMDAVPPIIHVDSAEKRKQDDSGTDIKMQFSAQRVTDARLAGGGVIKTATAISGGKIYSDRGYEWTYLAPPLKGLEQLMLPDYDRSVVAWDWLRYSSARLES